MEKRKEKKGVRIIAASSTTTETFDESFDLAVLIDILQLTKESRGFLTRLIQLAISSHVVLRASDDPRGCHLNRNLGSVGSADCAIVIVY